MSATTTSTTSGASVSAWPLSTTKVSRYEKNSVTIGYPQQRARPPACRRAGATRGSAVVSDCASPSVGVTLSRRWKLGKHVALWWQVCNLPVGSTPASYKLAATGRRKEATDEAFVDRADCLGVARPRPTPPKPAVAGALPLFSRRG